MKATILIVEDEDLVRAMLQLAFERRGFVVLTATCAADGLALAGTHSLDAVLTDFKLPGDDGLKLCRALQKQSEALGAHLSIWIMTGSHELTDKEAVDAGALELFRKPFLAPQICNRISRFLGASAESSEIRNGPEK